MNVTILHTEDCPNLEPLLAELRSVIDGRDDVTVTATLVRSDADAVRLGFRGSPTILIDGTDPFPGPAGPVGLSCRSYPCCAAPGAPAPGHPTRERLAGVLSLI